MSAGHRAVVSVVIPTFNRCLMLAPAIDSVLHQTYKHVEVIVVDDGSTDGTRDLLEEFAGAVRVIYQENSGPARARNAGIECAGGEYVAFLDSDDLWLPEKLERQLNLINRTPSAGFCYTQCFDEVNGRRKPGGSRRQGFDEMLTGWSRILTSSVLVGKRCLKSVGPFNETLRGTEDYELWLRLLREFEGVFLDEPLVVNRQHEDSLTADKAGHVAQRVYIFRELLPAMNLGGSYDSLLRAGLFYFRYLHAVFLQREKRYEEACREYLSLLADDPLISVRLCAWPMYRDSHNWLTILWVPYAKIIQLLLSYWWSGGRTRDRSAD